MIRGHYLHDFGATHSIGVSKSKLGKEMKTEWKRETKFPRAFLVVTKFHDFMKLPYEMKLSLKLRKPTCLWY